MELDELAFASQTALQTLFALLHTAPGALSFMLGHFLSPCLSLGSFVHNALTVVSSRQFSTNTALQQLFVLDDA